MARVAAALLVFAFCVTGAAAKTPPAGVRICGTSGCVRVVDRQVARSLGLTEPRRAPVTPAPFLTVRYLGGDALTPKTTMFYVPSAHALRVRANDVFGEWHTVEPDLTPQFVDAAARVRPFVPPSQVEVLVDRRPATDDASYLSLFTLTGPVRSDPAGRPPTGSSWIYPHAWTKWYARVHATWAYVDVRSTPPTPWSDGWSDLWVAKHASLVRRDGTVFAVEPRLAASIRAARSLR